MTNLIPSLLFRYIFVTQICRSNVCFGVKPGHIRLRPLTMLCSSVSVYPVYCTVGSISTIALMTILASPSNLMCIEFFVGPCPATLYDYSLLPWPSCDFKCYHYMMFCMQYNLFRLRLYRSLDVICCHRCHEWSPG